MPAYNIDQVGVAWAIRPLRSIAKAWSWIHATEPSLSGPFDREGRLSWTVLADLMPEVRGVQAFSLSRSLRKDSEKRELEIPAWARRPSAYRLARSQVLPSPPILAQASDGKVKRLFASRLQRPSRNYS